MSIRAAEIFVIAPHYTIKLCYTVGMATAQKQPINMGLKVYIADAIREALDDPDLGLELTAWAKKRLLSAKNKKGKLVPMSEIRKKYY